ncbi:MAG: Pyruvate ferredoxin oxidoreductase alpha subunit [Candidatus Falkowbacteria bacterium GW2011_GWC2_38_22]|uniref:Pyruvate ferredoxin oxidoreductase alpha subunit n=1 Tax=Candidatus Falkowbacteria bacterium GW2011_GWE1_38_31 TaxID=1618638 RepID=A0A0G0K4E9_9BACT|nr:MAG: Pyruvate ferredoxin oxidoreductase alpha subunit [Candidatus Falkowbacteria bacterium GW2011_GWF2_38_1205]KKQ61551.1 MAG: Pyruvate ferredoxin oxidoreductase alpha subunit [Candidatus Falkowbacteria bacterium GW2011_GWC2_38_22]KKQ63556.1 MAG: Pyruvate ferredoxin oxidoreductase alpha subunit [Candidatus Falkowbacteria bacterium GW2011_GWF1_38_22]KKQ65708.1 MAG: Pyruvate ferredoxin oxidoreductase alpha subunit [Candidatus Falkowbacteria bacterium GW2011_GWE2_38_254]KKQ70325.1 MAG: Pyruvate
MSTNKSNRQILEGSQAIAQLINNIKPGVVSAYPITPQTHIVENLAKFKADGKAKYEYVRAESEFAAASIVLGASATGLRVYTATSSQGLLLMNEVVYNIAGMRLPVVMTVANRGVSAPITIWNDHQDAMSVRDAGWIMLFAENHQEAIEQHLLAYKIAEKKKIPVMVNIDGFVLTHTYEGVEVPSSTEIKKFLPDYKPKAGEYLDTAHPRTFGAFAAPAHYMEIRHELHEDLRNCQSEILEEYESLKKLVPNAIKQTEKNAQINNGLVEYYGPKNPKIVLVAMGSLIGTIKDAVDKLNIKSHVKHYVSPTSVGVLKIKTFRPFPDKAIVDILKNAKYCAVIEKAVSLGATDGPLAIDIKSAAKNSIKTKIQSYVVGLGGRDITQDRIARIVVDVQKKDDRMKFVG